MEPAFLALGVAEAAAFLGFNGAWACVSCHSRRNRFSSALFFALDFVTRLHKIYLNNNEQTVIHWYPNKS